ncbi:MAG: pyridoxal phosphate-dependent aminotransferase [Acidobacteria bacterium]|jgi:aspartate aminotransferase|nr:pyridoxal phosphate-dependent aminotransferase [Acidobacteriota bacterium]
MKISQRAQNIQESPIRKLSALANAAKKRGTTVYHLNIGQPDIDTPPAFMERIINYKEKVLSYGPSDGLEALKVAMIHYFAYFKITLEVKNIVIATGGSEAIAFAFNAVADPGDEVIVSEPFYTNYSGYASQCGLTIVPVTAKAENGFHLPAIAEFEKKLTPRTRAVLICSPNNPTGTVYTPEELKAIGEFAREHDLFLIADEVYKEFTYDGKVHFSVLQLAGLEDRVIVVDSISKRYSACGARIGAVISRNEEVMKGITKFAQARLCPPTLEQVGAIGAYELPHDYFKEVMAEYQKRRDILYDILTSRREIVLQKPEGAFYIMAKLPIEDGETFARWLLNEFNDRNETVMIAPGEGFYSTPGKGKDEVRLAYVIEAAKLERAARLLLIALDKFCG